MRREEAGEGVGRPGIWLWCVGVEVEGQKHDGEVGRRTRYST